jgi:hypothetical protein
MGYCPYLCIFCKDIQDNGWDNGSFSCKKASKLTGTSINYFKDRVRDEDLSLSVCDDCLSLINEKSKTSSSRTIKIGFGFKFEDYSYLDELVTKSIDDNVDYSILEHFADAYLLLNSSIKIIDKSMDLSIIISQNFTNTQDFIAKWNLSFIRSDVLIAIKPNWCIIE